MDFKLDRFIYVAHTANTEECCIKIGVANNVNQRIQQHNKATTPYPLVLDFAVPGNAAIEQKLHKRLADSNFKKPGSKCREWYVFDDIVQARFVISSEILNLFFEFCLEFYDKNIKHLYSNTIITLGQFSNVCRVKIPLDFTPNQSVIEFQKLDHYGFRWSSEDADGTESDISYNLAFNYIDNTLTTVDFDYVCDYDQELISNLFVLDNDNLCKFTDKQKDRIKLNVIRTPHNVAVIIEWFSELFHFIPSGELQKNSNGDGIKKLTACMANDTFIQNCKSRWCDDDELISVMKDELSSINGLSQMFSSENNFFSNLWLEFVKNGFCNGYKSINNTPVVFDAIRQLRNAITCFADLNAFTNCTIIQNSYDYEPTFEDKVQGWYQEFGNEDFAYWMATEMEKDN